MSKYAEQGPREGRAIREAYVPPVLAAGMPVTFEGEPGVVIGNTGFGTVVVRLCNGSGRVIQFNITQYGRAVTIGHK